MYFQANVIWMPVVNVNTYCFINKSCIINRHKHLSYLAQNSKMGKTNIERTYIVNPLDKRKVANWSAHSRLLATRLVYVMGLFYVLEASLCNGGFAMQLRLFYEMEAFLCNGGFSV